MTPELGFSGVFVISNGNNNDLNTFDEITTVNATKMLLILFMAYNGNTNDEFQ